MALSLAVVGVPLGQAGPQRSFRGRRRARAGVVEREERGRAAVRGRDRILEEPVGLGVRGDAGVGVDVDHAGEDQHPGRVDHLGRGRRPGQIRLDRPR